MATSVSTPGVRRTSVVMGIVAGMLVGSMLTALVTAGDDEAIQATARGDAASGTTDSTPMTTSAAGTDTGSASAEITGSAAPEGGEVAPTVGAAAAPGSGTSSAAGPRAAATASAPASGACAGVPAAGVRGVTDTTIKIGIGLADLDALEPVLGPPAVLGDQQAHFRAHLEALRKKGVLPICGRDIVPVFRRYSVLDPTQSRAVCQAFINDDKVFAVLTQFSFGDANCVTVENKTFLLDHGTALTQMNYDAAGGRLFGLHPPVDTALRILTKWAIRTHLSGKKLGVYYHNANRDDEARVQRNVLSVLKEAGINPVIATTNTGTAGSPAGAQDPNNAIAVQRFKTEGVQVVINVGTGMQDDGKRQAFRPLYLRQGIGAKDSTSGSYDPEYMDGTVGVHWDQVNDFAAGAPVTPRAEECMKEVDAAGIKRPRREWAEWNGSNLGCDLLAVLVRGLQAAGRNLTQDRLVLGVRTIKNLDAALVAPLTYSAQKQWGINMSRDARYFKECKCWKNTGPFEPLQL